MSDPYTGLPRNPPGTNPPRYAPEPSNSGWITGAIVAALAVGVGFWALSQINSDSPRTAANPPAVTAPAPATRAPADETTGQAVPPAQTTTPPGERVSPPEPMAR
jgi:hypothetical protein